MELINTCFYLYFWINGPLAYGRKTDLTSVLTSETLNPSEALNLSNTSF